MVDQDEIHREAISSRVEERREAMKLLRSNFADLSDKEHAWDCLHRLTGDEDRDVRRGAARTLGSAFQYVLNKEEAGRDLHRLTEDEDSFVRWSAAGALGSAFQYVPEKEEAWRYLIQMTEDENRFVRWRAADALGSAFQYVSEKEAAGRDLQRLAENEDRYVRRGAVCALGSAFKHVLNKEEAGRDLHRLTEDEDSYVRSRATDALGYAFQYVSEKDALERDLQRLAEDENRFVRASANHSLGRVSIFKATEAESEEDFKSELKNALKFFERSAKEEILFNPSGFCLPFYRSFYTITFEREGVESEVQRYLADAKSVSEGSENKETLLEAVENLANALSETQKPTDFDAMKSELSAYRRYCERAADLIGAAEEGAPSAARVLRRGGQIIDERIKEIIREIQEKAEAVCRETRGTGTPYEPLGIEANKLAGELSDRDYLWNEKNVSRIVHILGEFCDLLLEDKREYPCKIVEEIREESELEDKLSSIATAFSYLQPCIESQLQNAAKPTTDEMRSDKQPSQKTGHSTTVIAEPGSNVTLAQTETESGDVTVTHNAKAIEESKPDKHRIDHRKRTAIEILAAIAVSVLVAILSPRYLEDLTPTASTVIAFIAFIILLVMILTRNRDRSS